MYLVKLAPGGATDPPPAGHERFVFFLDGAANLTRTGRTLHANSYSYFPPGDTQGLTTDHGAGLLVYERQYSLNVRCYKVLHRHIWDTMCETVNGVPLLLLLVGVVVIGLSLSCVSATYDALVKTQQNVALVLPLLSAPRQKAVQTPKTLPTGQANCARWGN